MQWGIYIVIVERRSPVRSVLSRPVAEVALDLMLSLSGYRPEVADFTGRNRNGVPLCSCFRLQPLNMKLYLQYVVPGLTFYSEHAIMGLFLGFKLVLLDLSSHLGQPGFPILLGLNFVLLDLSSHSGQQRLLVLLGLGLELTLRLGLAVLNGPELGLKIAGQLNLLSLHGLLGLPHPLVNHRLGLGGHLGLVVEQLTLGFLLLGSLLASLLLLKCSLSTLRGCHLSLGHLLGDGRTGFGDDPALLCETNLSLVLNIARMSARLLSKCSLRVASKTLKGLLDMAQLCTEIVFSWAWVRDRRGSRTGQGPKGPGQGH